MCLIVLRFDPSAETPLLLVANRDEFHDRPTEPLHWWAEVPILAGRDRRAGGTWLGVDATGRFGALTNLRGANAPDKAPSRGDLIPAFLTSRLAPEQFLNGLRNSAHRYAGFNLLLGDRRGVFLYCNAEPEVVRAIAPGTHALSNGRYGDPWPKVVKASSALDRHLLEGRDHALLREVLADRSVAADELLPDTGIPVTLERRLSAAFIVADDYGTRSTTVCALTHGRGWIEETTYSPNGTQVAAIRAQFPT